MTHAFRMGGCLVTLSLLAACATATDAEEGAPTTCPGALRGAGLPSPGGGLVEEPAFATATAGLKMWVHAPATLGKDPPIVVAMHGCTESANDYLKAGWNELADASGFVVVYPEQSTANHQMRCFRWWAPEHTTRDRGEAKAIAAMVERARSKYGSGGKVFVTGLSAGGAMTAVMLAAYPDVFEAGAVMSGLPYGCARTETEAYGCMSGKEQTSAAWAAAVPALAKSKPPRVAVWHGDADWTVRPKAAEGLVRQWTAVNGVSAEPSAETTVGRATHVEYKDASGEVRVESWMIKGMGHGVALAPQEDCGRAGAYMLDVGVCSTATTAAFFGLLTPGATAPPGAAQPGPGATPPRDTPSDPCD